jgi:hypothetical protein
VCTASSSSVQLPGDRLDHQRDAARLQLLDRQLRPYRVGRVVGTELPVEQALVVRDGQLVGRPAAHAVLCSMTTTMAARSASRRPMAGSGPMACRFGCSSAQRRNGDLGCSSSSTQRISRSGCSARTRRTTSYFHQRPDSGSGAEGAAAACEVARSPQRRRCPRPSRCLRRSAAAGRGSRGARRWRRGPRLSATAARAGPRGARPASRSTTVGDQVIGQRCRPPWPSPAASRPTRPHVRGTTERVPGRRPRRAAAVAGSRAPDQEAAAAGRRDEEAGARGGLRRARRRAAAPPPRRARCWTGGAAGRAQGAAAAAAAAAPTPPAAARRRRRR